MTEDWPVCQTCGRRHPSHNDLYQAIIADSFTDETFEVELTPKVFRTVITAASFLTPQITGTHNLAFSTRFHDLFSTLEALILDEVVENGLNLLTEEPVKVEFHIRDLTLIIYLLEEYAEHSEMNDDILTAIDAFGTVTSKGQ